jgi:hypothetical protein
MRAYRACFCLEIIEQNSSGSYKMKNNDDSRNVKISQILGALKICG